ncbi:MAG: deoxyribonuclease V [Candidatus Thorarchaeota archaeon]
MFLPQRFSTKKALEVQLEFANRVSVRDDFNKPLQRVCGLDVAYHNQTAVGVAVLMSFPQMQMLEHAIVYCQSPIPYIPTYLSFREYPPLSLAFSALQKKPDLVFVDAHGRAHPRMLGAASHFGVLKNIPTIGVAKRLLCGEIHSCPESFDNIIFKDQIVGARVTSKAGCNPIYVSIGHRISLKTAVDITLNCVTTYRLPEPTRWAHRYATEARQMLKKKG